jgi:hypothetical protein
VFYGLRGEVDVLFVDIGGIVDHQCLIFLLFCCGQAQKCGGNKPVNGDPPLIIGSLTTIQV